MQLPLEIECEELQELRAGNSPPLLIDCREPEEHELVAIEGDLLLPMSEMPQRIAELSEFRNSRIVVYCHFGMRSAQVAVWLRDQQFTQVQSLSGGIDTWAVRVEPGMTRY